MSHSPQNHLQPKVAMKSADRRLLQMTFAAQKHKKAVGYKVRILQQPLEAENILIGRSP